MDSTLGKQTVQKKVSAAALQRLRNARKNVVPDTGDVKTRQCISFREGNHYGKRKKKKKTKATEKRPSSSSSRGDDGGTTQRGGATARTARTAATARSGSSSKLGTARSPRRRQAKFAGSGGITFERPICADPTAELDVLRLILLREACLQRLLALTSVKARQRSGGPGGFVVRRATMMR